MIRRELKNQPNLVTGFLKNINGKQIFKVFAVFLMVIGALGSAGCRQTKKRKEPNEGRGTEYAYDFVDFVNITTYGDNGDGYIEITPKNIDVYDFANEKDYIAVKKDLEEMGLVYKQGGNNNTSGPMQISKTTELSNGDIISISINLPKDYEKKSDINTETYDYVVHDLGTADEIDLFDSGIVTFYATQNGDICYHLHAPNYISQEMADNLVYIAKTTNELEAGVTILDCTVTMDEDFLKKNEYYTIDVYLAKHNLKAETTSEKVLGQIIEPVTFSSSNQAAIEGALYTALYAEEPQLTKICNLQQLDRQAVSDPYKTIVLYYTTNDYGEREYFRREVELHYIDNSYVVYKVEQRNGTSERFMSESLDGGQIVLDFNLEAKPEEEVTAEEPAAVEETVENTGESTAEDTGENANPDQPEGTQEG